MNVLPFFRFLIFVGISVGYFVPVRAVSAQRPPRSAGPAQLPKVVLVGDSIRLGYAPIVARLLSGKATVVSVEANGGDSANVLRNLEEWVVKEKPDIVHLNAGLHDLKVSKQARE